MPSTSSAAKRKRRRHQRKKHGRRGTGRPPKRMTRGQTILQRARDSFVREVVDPSPALQDKLVKAAHEARKRLPPAADPKLLYQVVTW